MEGVSNDKQNKVWVIGTPVLAVVQLTTMTFHMVPTFHVLEVIKCPAHG